jgi:hypothetical protein
MCTRSSVAGIGTQDDKASPLVLALAVAAILDGLPDPGSKTETLVVVRYGPRVGFSAGCSFPFSASAERGAVKCVSNASEYICRSIHQALPRHISVGHSSCAPKKLIRSVSSISSRARSPPEKKILDRIAWIPTGAPLSLRPQSSSASLRACSVCVLILLGWKWEACLFLEASQLANRALRFSPFLGASKHATGHVEPPQRVLYFQDLKNAVQDGIFSISPC